jgi:DNA-binding response OmpR family regulator
MDDNAKKPVVLHVEDDDGCAYLLRLALREENANIDVFRLCDGVDAILFLNREGVFADAPHPDVVVLDLNLPQKDGHEIVAEIRRQADLQDLPLIMFSSSSRREDKEKALGLGANHYFEKSSQFESFTDVALQVMAYISK